MIKDLSNLEKILLFIVGLITAFALDSLIGYLLDTIRLAGIVVVPYIIIVLVAVFDEKKEEDIEKFDEAAEEFVEKLKKA